MQNGQNSLMPNDVMTDPSKDEKPQMEGPKGDGYEWSAFHDDEGRIYYYNNETGESSWEPPEKFNPPPPKEDEAAAESTGAEKTEEDKSNGNLQDSSMNGTTTSDEAKSPKAEESAWIAYQDDEGREYYFNTVTEETTWDQPANFTRESTVEEPETTKMTLPQSPVIGEEGPTTPMSPNEQPEESEMEVEPTGEDEGVKEPEEVIDPAVQRLKEAEDALKQPDAIMEPGVMKHVTEVFSSDGGDATRAIQSLSQSYFGRTAACGLMGRWLADLKSQSTASDVADQSTVFQKSAEEIRDMAQDVINRIAKEKFTNQVGDSILSFKNKERAFLRQMMDSPRWRKLLIDLSASNKDSALLRYCLSTISKRGHHREIARRIDQSDHFVVFNSMLSSELACIGKIAVSACNENDTSISLEELVADLRRTCTSTAYTYIYTLEVLRHIVSTSKEQLSSRKESEASKCFERAVRKWERLSEDLQGSMVDPSSTGSTPLFRKRRLDMSVTISELHQRQRRRLMPSLTQDSSEASSSKNGEQGKLETSVLSFLRRYSLGTQIDDRILDAMLPSGSLSMSGILVGHLLMKRPLTIKALLGYLYKPGSQRIRSVVTKNKCARLVALSVLAAEEEVCAEAKEIGIDINPEADEVSLTRMLIEGSELCERLENMVSFVVTRDPTKKKGLSPGEDLVGLAMKCVPVAQGVAIWARQIVKGSDFVQSGTYPTVSPSVLSLIRVLYTEHPCIRDDTLEVAFSFLAHSSSNSDVSYQKLNEIKEQSLRLLLFLAVRGDGPAVLTRITTLLTESGNSSLDASLVRYFVTGLLQVVRAPFSAPFVRAFASLLKAPGCVGAVRTSYFEAKSKLQLDTVIREFKKVADEQGLLTSEDIGMVRSISSIYSS